MEFTSASNMIDLTNELSITISKKQLSWRIAPVPREFSHFHRFALSSLARGTWRFLNHFPYT